MTIVHFTAMTIHLAAAHNNFETRQRSIDIDRREQIVCVHSRDRHKTQFHKLTKWPETRDLLHSRW